MAVYRNFVEQPAQVSDEQVAEIEERYRADFIVLRLALASLARSGAYLAEGVDADENARAFADVAQRTDELSERLKSLAALMQTASLRLELALCKRPDMQTLVEMAKNGTAMGRPS
jgi:hypothetical protein